MKWKDDFWNVKRKKLDDESSLDAWKKWRKEHPGEYFLYEKWKVFARKKALQIERIGYKPLLLTIRTTQYWHPKPIPEEIERFLQYIEAKYPKIRVVDIYCHLPYDSPVGRNFKKGVSGWWLRCDYNQDKKGNVLWLFEVLKKGTLSFSSSDYQGYIVGDGFGNRTLNPIKVGKPLVDYNKAFK